MRLNFASEWLGFIIFIEPGTIFLLWLELNIWPGSLALIFIININIDININIIIVAYIYSIIVAYIYSTLFIYTAAFATSSPTSATNTTRSNNSGGNYFVLSLLPTFLPFLIIFIVAVVLVVCINPKLGPRCRSAAPQQEDETPSEERGTGGNISNGIKWNLLSRNWKLDKFRNWGNFIRSKKEYLKFSLIHML